MTTTLSPKEKTMNDFDRAMSRYDHQHYPWYAFESDYLNGYCDEFGREIRDDDDDEDDDDEQQNS